jgi:hypothetical protein
MQDANTRTPGGLCAAWTRRVGLCAMLAAAPVMLTLSGLVATPGARAQSDVDITKIFWCKDGQNGGQTASECAASRDLILQNCTSCHSFVPIVKAQKTAAEWDASLGVHRSRVSDVSDDDYAKLRQYLIAHFNPQNPKPELPPELEKLGIDQPA